MIANLEYTEHRTPFQEKLLQDADKIKQSGKLFVAADKTNNVYEIGKKDYEKLMRDNVTTHYKKTEPEMEHNINMQAKQITESLTIDDRVEPIAPKPAYITIKDHKEGFPNTVKCRLINPAKTNVGKIGKKLVHEINEKIRAQLKLQQWRSTHEALDWFKKLEHKKNKQFLMLDIVDFYPSISENLFDQAVEFASETTTVGPEVREILTNCRQSLLFHNDATWQKHTGLFDVSMGAYDSCEVCELVGLFIIHKLKKEYPCLDFGLYRDDGLAAHDQMNGQMLERMRQGISKTFKELGLKITIETSLTVAKFLDVTFDLHREKYYPYRKPNDTPRYIHRESNHPRHITKNLPTAVGKRLSELSHNKETFDEHKADYEKALKESQLKAKLVYTPEKPKEKRNRKRNIIWYNPPYNASLKTNFGREFLKILDKNFPVNNDLHCILNRKTVKLSYSCTANMAQLMKKHNNKILSQTKTTETATRCNCRNKNTCPTPGKCCTPCVIYKAEVQNEEKAFYIGQTDGEFKTRYNNHTHSFRKEEKRNSTTLSQYIWDKGLQPEPTIKWAILKKCRSYAPGHSFCGLCNTEKKHIIRNSSDPKNINKKTDLGKKCLHIRGATLSEIT